MGWERIGVWSSLRHPESTREEVVLDGELSSAETAFIEDG